MAWTKMSVIYHVEHGDTAFDQKGLAQGLSNVGLTPKGKSQARRAGRMLRGKGIDCVYTSPLRRAVETANIICEEIGDAKVIVRKNLRPPDIGTLMGKKETTVKSYLEFYSTRPTLPFPDGEKFGDWYKLAKAEWKHQFADDDPVIAVVSHGKGHQLLKHWERNGLDAGPEGIAFIEPGSAQITKATRSGNSIQTREVS